MAKLKWTNQEDAGRESEIKELKEYLQKTDFYYIRETEIGKAVPPHIKEERIRVRQRLQELGL